MYNIYINIYIYNTHALSVVWPADSTYTLIINVDI